MRWALACIGLIVVMVVFAFAALDQKNVVWVDGKAECPHCRNVVRDYSSVCAECGRAFDWQGYETECEACLSELDSEFLRKRFLGHEAEFEEILRESNVPPEAVPDLLMYARAYRSGSCGFCGGTGRWLAPGVWEGGGPENGDHGPRVEILKRRLEGRCPICFGSGRCVLCNGDHLTDHAREAAARDLVDLERLCDEVDPLRDPESEEVLFGAIEDFVGRHAGRVQIREVRPFHGASRQARHLDWALHRRDIVVGLLQKLP